MGSKGKVFVLDDDELIVSVLSRALKKEGYEICGETETIDVINKIRAWDPDIIILDLGLPGRNGMDILREIKNRKMNTQVVILTADDSEETAAKAVKLGAAEYLTKPFDTDEVKSAIRNTLGS